MAPVDGGSGEKLSVRHALREATWTIHERLHHHPLMKPLTGPTLTLGQYRAALIALHGFHAPIERRLAAWEVADSARVALLVADLQALGAVVDGLDEAADLPDLSAPPARLAARYVLDGSAHGGRSMLPNVRRALGLDGSSGASFLASAGVDAKGGWKALLARLESDLDTPAGRAAACASAVALFEALERWLDLCAERLGETA